MLLFKRKTKYDVISEIPATFAVFAKYQQLSENNLQPGQSGVWDFATPKFLEFTPMGFEGEVWYHRNVIPDEK